MQVDSMPTLLVNDVFNITGHGIVLVGQVQEGVLLVGMRAAVLGYVVQIQKMEANHQELPQARQGDRLGIGVSKVDGPEEPAQKMFGLFSKSKYAESMKGLKGKVVEFG